MSESEQPLGAGGERAHHRGEQGVRGDVDEDAVEPGVRGGDRGIVAAGHRGLGKGHLIAKLGETGFGRASGGEADGEDLKGLAHIEQVADVVGGEGGDDRALSRDQNDEAVALQELHGLA